VLLGAAARGPALLAARALDAVSRRRVARQPRRSRTSHRARWADCVLVGTAARSGAAVDVRRPGVVVAAAVGERAIAFLSRWSQAQRKRACLRLPDSTATGAWPPSAASAALVGLRSRQSPARRRGAGARCRTAEACGPAGTARPRSSPRRSTRWRGAGGGAASPPRAGSTPSATARAPPPECRLPANSRRREPHRLPGRGAHDGQRGERLPRSVRARL
jgi:hypothetical protein